MSQWHRDRWGLGVSSSEIALATKDATGQAVICDTLELEWPSGLASESTWLNALQQWLGDRGQRGDWTLNLASDLCHWWTVEPLIGTASLNDLKQYAKLRFNELFGVGETQQWLILGDWQMSGGNVCCAVPQALLESVVDMVRARRSRLLGAAPAVERLLSLTVPRGKLSLQPRIDVAIVFDSAVLQWRTAKQVFKLSCVVVDPQNPWPRITQEVFRAGAQLPEIDQPVSLHWRSTHSLIPMEIAGLQLVSCLNGLAGHGTDASSAAQAAALLAV